VFDVRRFLILCPILSISSLTNSCCTECVYFWLPLRKRIVAAVGMCGTQLFPLLLFCDNPICHYLYCVIFFIIFNVQFNLLTTCFIVAVCRCTFIIPATNIGGCGAGCCLSCLALPPVSACCTDSGLFVVVNWVTWMFASFGVFFSSLALLWFWSLFRWLLARITDRHCHSFWCFLLFLRSLLLGLMLCCYLGCVGCIIGLLW
jgi:hypothetical protein